MGGPEVLLMPPPLSLQPPPTSPLLLSTFRLPPWVLKYHFSEASFPGDPFKLEPDPNNPTPLPFFSFLSLFHHHVTHYVPPLAKLFIGLSC